MWRAKHLNQTPVTYIIEASNLFDRETISIRMALCFAKGSSVTVKKRVVEPHNMLKDLQYDATYIGLNSNGNLMACVLLQKPRRHKS